MTAGGGAKFPNSKNNDDKGADIVTHPAVAAVAVQRSVKGVLLVDTRSVNINSWKQDKLQQQ